MEKWKNIVEIAVVEGFEVSPYYSDSLGGDTYSGVKINFDGTEKLSVISHNFSYGGNLGLYEWWESLKGIEPEGFKTEEEVLHKIIQIKNGMRVD